MEKQPVRTPPQAFLLNIQQKEQILKAIVTYRKEVHFKSINDFDVYLGTTVEKGELICLYDRYVEKVFNHKVDEAQFVCLRAALSNPKNRTFIIVRPRKMMPGNVSKPSSNTFLKHQDSIYETQRKDDFNYNILLTLLWDSKITKFKYSVVSNRIYLPPLKEEKGFSVTVPEPNSTSSTMKVLEGDFLIFPGYLIDNLPADCQIIIVTDGIPEAEIFKISKEKFIDLKAERAMGYGGLDAQWGISLEMLRKAEKISDICKVGEGVF